MMNPAADDAPSPTVAATILVPASLRTWFRVHCAIDVVAALPLLLFPQRILGLLGWTAIDPVATRLCGAALLGIGGASVLVERHGLAGYRTLLGLKVIWSAAAIFALLAGIADGAPPAAWALLSIFIAFSGIWMSYVIRLRQLERFGLLDDGGGESDGEEEADPSP
jgi:urea transporter